MAWTKLSRTLIGNEVDRVFDGVSGKPGDSCMNPITGEQFIYGYFSMKREKEAAYRRLLVREYFALSGPSDAPLVPMDEWDRDRAKHLSGLLGFVTTQFMWSVESQDDLRMHPSFADFASGILWQHENEVEGYSLSYFPSDQIAELKRRFPPRKLEGLTGFDWCPPRRQKTPKGNSASRLTGSLVDSNEGEYAGVDV
jgi:hypothetical protein